MNSFTYNLTFFFRKIMNFIKKKDFPYDHEIVFLYGVRYTFEPIILRVYCIWNTCAVRSDSVTDNLHTKFFFTSEINFYILTLCILVGSFRVNEMDRRMLKIFYIVCLCTGNISFTLLCFERWMYTDHKQGTYFFIRQFMRWFQ